MKPEGLYYTIDHNSPRAAMPNVPIMVPATSFYRASSGRLLVPNIPDQVIDRAADCGGFTAMRIYEGYYPFTPPQYVNWLDAWRPTWAATFDFCCELEIATNREELYRRQQWTTDYMRHFYHRYRSVPWMWIPTLQGWEVGDYVRHATAIKGEILDMKDRYGPSFRVGIGTLCRRASTKMIRAVVMACSAALPGVQFHLWGVKLDFLKSGDVPLRVISTDTAAFNGHFYEGREEYAMLKATEGLSQWDVTFTRKLPEYQAKVETALAKPTQLSIFDRMQS